MFDIFVVVFCLFIIFWFFFGLVISFVVFMSGGLNRMGKLIVIMMICDRIVCSFLLGNYLLIFLKR